MELTPENILKSSLSSIDPTGTLSNILSGLQNLPLFKGKTVNLSWEQSHALADQIANEFSKKIIDDLGKDFALGNFSVSFLKNSMEVMERENLWSYKDRQGELDLILKEMKTYFPKWVNEGNNKLWLGIQYTALYVAKNYDSDSDTEFMEKFLYLFNQIYDKTIRENPIDKVSKSVNGFLSSLLGESSDKLETNNTKVIILSISAFLILVFLIFLLYKKG